MESNNDDILTDFDKNYAERYGVALDEIKLYKKIINTAANKLYAESNIPVGDFSGLISMIDGKPSFKLLKLDDIIKKLKD